MRTQFITLVSLSLTCLSAVACAQATRSFEVKVLDEVGQPLSDAQVIVQPQAQPITHESSFNTLPKTFRILGRAKTNAEGMATVDVAEGELKEDEQVAVTAWKLGFGPSSATIQKKAVITCAPSRARNLQILDSTGKPAQGLRVAREGIGAKESEHFDPPWWTSSEQTTNELGLVSLEMHSNGYQSLLITESDGTQHRFSAASMDLRGRISGRPTDVRDLNIVTLVPHGKLNGKLPADTAQHYGVRAIRDVRNSLARLRENKTTVQSEVRIDADGQFHFDALEEGEYWIVVYRKTPYDGSIDAPLQRQPVATNRVTIESGKTASIQVGLESLTKVSGRIVGEEGASDFKGKLIVLSKKTPSPYDARSGYFHPLVRAVCAADGSFVAWVPSGKYQVNSGVLAGYRVGTIPEFEIGSGAASVTLDNIVLTPTKSLKVVWPGKPLLANTIQGLLNSRLIFQLKDNMRVDCALSADGYGKVDLPLNAEVAQIDQDPTMTASKPSESSFNDLDESENFLLELKTTAQGAGTNVSVRGKVVDANNQPLAGVPVTIQLTFEPVAQPANNNTPGSYSFVGSMGSQMIDQVTTQYDGTYQVSPRQLLRKLTIPGREVENECKFTFTALTLVNPDSIDVRKTYQFKPSEWNVAQVELPDLVIDRPFGGQRLTGKLLDAEGKPSVGELVRLNDKRHIVRALTDRDGNFEFEDVAGPTWLLREKDWSIHAVSDYSQPLILPLVSKESNKPDDPAAESCWKRADLDQRRALAKEVLQGIVNGQPNGLSDEAYLEPEKFFQATLLRGGPNFDEARFQFVNFWTDLKDEQLEQLSAATNRTSYKAFLLKILANRKPSVEAYKRAMDALEIPESGNYLADSLINEIADLSIKLHHLGALEPYRGKIQQFLDYWNTQKAKERAQLNLPANLPGNVQRMSMLEPETVVLCRALLNPEDFAASMADQLPIDSNELSPEDRVVYSRNMAILIRLYPVEQLKVLNEGMPTNNEYYMELGALAPRAAFEATKQGKLTGDILRIVMQSALASGHPDGQAAFLESVPWLMQSDGVSRIYSMNVGRPSEISLYEAASHSSPELGRVAAWILAYDYLSGKYDDSPSRVLPIMERRNHNMLGIAYSLAKDYPVLAQRIAERAVPRLLNQIESDYDLPFSRSGDVSLSAYFDPKATVDLLLKLQKRLDEEMKNQPARPTNGRMYGKRNTLSSLRATCLRGLLLEKM